MDESVEAQSITRWFSQLRSGDEQAADLLWQHYFPRLVDVARTRFNADRLVGAGADDAAQSVFYLLCRGIKDGRFNDVTGRDELWRLLVSATRRKVIDHVRHDNAAKRGGDVVTFPISTDMVAPDPSPELIAIMNERAKAWLGTRRLAARSFGHTRIHAARTGKR